MFSPETARPAVRGCLPMEKMGVAMQAVAVAVVLAIAGMAGCGGTAFSDISPDAPSGSSSGGLTYALAGGDGALYAVSLNAGLWRSPKSRVWSQLKGPRYALSVAVDPVDPTHLAVGERDGDAREVRLNEAGVWESFDSGTTWSYTLNPMLLPDPSTGTAPCSSQVVPSVVFTKSSSLVAATACGIARKAKGAATFVAAATPTGTSLVSALVVSQTKVWARTPVGVLLVSVDDGKNFAAATSKPLPAGVGFSDRGDDFSLAASDAVVAMSGCCASSGPAPVNGHLANEMIIYRVSGDSWSVQPILGSSGGTTTDGIYVGGRRFMRSFNVDSGGVRFFFCNSQAVWEVDLAGTQTLIASSGVDIAVPTSANFAGGIHSDLWDFALDPAGKIMWIASDGGVYENRSDSTGWKSAVSGLHTQHVQTLDVVLATDGTRVAYATQDNDAWFGQAPNWSTTGQLGDTNWSDADAGSPAQSFLGRSLRAFVIQSLDGVSPTSNWRTTPSVLTDPNQPSGPLFLQFIQSVKGETGVPLDAIMLLNRPVRDTSTPPNPIVPPPALAGLAQNGNPWLLRNQSWASEPDFYRALANGNWSAELTDLPNGTDRVFVSGGHAGTHYFALVREQSGLSLFERKDIQIRVRPGWVRVFAGVIDWTTQCSGFQGWYGPVFVNPYDASKVYLLTPSGVKVSQRDLQGNLIFFDDPILTNLITASGSFPIVREFCGGNPAQVPIASRTLGASTLAHVSFFRDAPTRTVIASPFVGGFYDNGDGIWRSFSNLLPRGPLWAVRLDNDNAYFGFAGRSVGRVSSPGDADRATYFQPDKGFIPRLGGGLSTVAKLLVSDGTVGAGETVSLRIIGPDGTTRYFVPVLRLDSSGRVLVPPFNAQTGLIVQAGFVVHIHFDGDPQAGLAASEIHFVY
jgi:hypothetical protein